MAGLHLLCAVISVTLWIGVTHCTDSSTAFHDELNSFANKYLGARDLQNYIERTDYTIEHETIEDLLETLTESLSDKFERRISVVLNLRDKLEEIWSDLPSRSTFDYCCSYISAAAEVDENFQTLVDRRTACEYGKGLEGNPTKFMNEEINKVMKSNLNQNPSIKYQYVGTEEGTMTVYPKFRQCSDTYDPRFRPWYVESATPDPKKVVAVIDTSGSMNSLYRGRTLIDIAKEAAKTVINTLNPNDWTTVVSFSTRASKAPICSSDQLALGTPHNKKSLSSFITSLKAIGGTEYHHALEAAFDYFTVEDAIGSSDLVILFLTDGLPTDGTDLILNTIAERNARLRNRVTILTYGLGSEVGDDILTDIADQSHNDPIHGEIQRGKYTNIRDPDNLRTALGSFYTFFRSKRELNNPIITVPYFDAFGLGLITSICLPVYYLGNLKGVTCVDMSMSDLLSDVAFFGRTDSAYAFIMGPNGRLMMHPLLSSPQSLTDEPVFIQMDTLETSEGAKAVMESMLSGESGSSDFTSWRVKSRGRSETDGSLAEIVESQYAWTRVSPTNYSVCVVTEKGANHKAISNTNYEATEEFTYHRLDLLSGVDKCSYLNTEATVDTTVVMLSLAAFEQPYLQVIHEETEVDVQQYESYFTSKNYRYSGFKPDVHRYVALSEFFKSHLFDGSDDLLNRAVWVYVGFNVGVFRLYPGIRLDKYYDPVYRPWYQKAEANKGKLVSSLPYTDAFGAGSVITLCKTLLSPGQSLTDRDIIGVVGIDFKMEVFYYFMTDSFPECLDTSTSGCVIIDSAGYIVMHSDWLNLQSDSVFPVHITQMENNMAKQLVQNGIMSKVSCINYEDHLKQYYWIVALRDRKKEMESSTIHAIEETNLFVIVIKSRQSESSTVGCRTQDMRILPSCSSFYSIQCPCYEEMEFDFCTNTPAINSDSSPPCAQSPPEKDPPRPDSYPKTTTAPPSTTELPLCHDPECEQKTSERDCWITSLCSWNGRECKHVEDKKESESQSESEKSSWSYYYLIAVGAGLLIICFVSCWVCKSRKQQNTGNTSPPLKQRMATAKKHNDGLENTAFEDTEYENPIDSSTGENGRSQADKYQSLSRPTASIQESQEDVRTQSTPAYDNSKHEPKYDIPSNYMDVV